jgi:hypothetical protein
MKDFFQIQREGIAIFIYIGAIVVLIYFVVLPLIAYIDRTKNQIQEEYVKQEIKEQQIKELPKIEAQYNVLKNNEKSIDVLLEKDNAIELIKRLEEIAQDSGNDISISIQNSAAQKNTMTVVKDNANIDDGLIKSLPSADYLQIKITLTGDYNAVVKFIHLIENFEYYCDILAIKINQKEEQNKISEIGTKISTNPFDSNKEKNIEETINSNDNKLEAILDVVFYTKK